MQGTLTMNRCNLSPSLVLIIVILIGLGTTFSYVGYYQTRWIEDDITKVFIKKQPTYKIRFINVFRSDHEDNWNGYMEEKERQYAFDFCKYYVGFDTPMKTVTDFHECKQVYEGAITSEAD